jgi:methionyl-tRNA synthetase
MISIDDFKNVEIKVGTILSAHKIEGADKLLLLSVDMNEETPRQIVSGIAEQFPDPEALVRKQVAFVTNLEPRVIRGYESQGMILACADDDNFALLVPHTSVASGTKAR